MNSDILTGSICLSDIPRELIKEVICKDGTRKKYLNIAILPRKEKKVFESNGRKRELTHLISCSPKPELRVEGRNYFIGDLQTFRKEPQMPSNYVDPEDIERADPFAKSKSEEEDLPF
ncbi:MAG: hypothetical protein K2O78_08340 [Muribaculaceae bacterium]|nr:hypothetical protein [Muribaculaceae bacterium]